MMSGRQRGAVKKYDAQRGYGFVSSDTGSADQFVHVSNIFQCPPGGLRVGQRVEFTIGVNREGREQAVDVKIVED
jgi:cold shock protein